MLTVVKGYNFLQELDLDWAALLIINLGMIFKIEYILFRVLARRLKLQPIFSITVLITIVQDKPSLEK